MRPTSTTIATSSILRSRASPLRRPPAPTGGVAVRECRLSLIRPGSAVSRSEEHTSELQSQVNLVCRLLLEKKKPDLFSPLVEDSLSPAALPTTLATAY